MLSILVNWCMMQYILFQFPIPSNCVQVMGGKELKTIFRLNIFIITKLKVQSINYIAFTDRTLNKLVGGCNWVGSCLFL